MNCSLFNMNLLKLNIKNGGVFELKTSIIHSLVWQSFKITTAHFIAVLISDGIIKIANIVINVA